MRTRQDIHNSTCSIDGCGAPFSCRTYCAKHYLRYWKYGDPLFTKKDWSRQKLECSVTACTLDAHSKGYCKQHYRRNLKYGTPDTIRPLVGLQRHGLAGTPIYKTWSSMKDRCLNNKSKNYKHYGGRGITIYPPWIKSVQLFYEYMGDRPPHMSIERIDVNGNYEPGNVKWADAQEQAENRRDTIPRHQYKKQTLI